MREESDLTPEKTDRLLELARSPDVENQVIASEIIGQITRVKENIGYLVVILKEASDKVPIVKSKLRVLDAIAARYIYDRFITWNDVINIVRSYEEHIDPEQKYYVIQNVIYYISDYLRLTDEQTRKLSENIERSSPEGALLRSLPYYVEQVVE